MVNLGDQPPPTDTSTKRSTLLCKTYNQTLFLQLTEHNHVHHLALSYHDGSHNAFWKSANTAVMCRISSMLHISVCSVQHVVVDLNLGYIDKKI